MVRWLASIHPAALFTAFVVVGLVTTYLIDALTRRLIDDETRSRATHTAGVTLQVAATIYAILIAFVIVDEYAELRSTQAQISSTAASLVIITENGRTFPQSDARAIRGAAVSYARATIGSELPRLKDTSSTDPSDARALARLFQAVRAVEPTTAAQRTAYDASLRSLDDLVHTKAELVDSSRVAVPPTLLWILFIVSFGVMAVATLLDTRHRRSHLFILGSLTVVMWLTLALVVSLDYPFRGLIRVTDEPLRAFVHIAGAL